MLEDDCKKKKSVNFMNAIRSTFLCIVRNHGNQRYRGHQWRSTTAFRRGNGAQGPTGRAVGGASSSLVEFLLMGVASPPGWSFLLHGGAPPPGRSLLGRRYRVPLAKKSLHNPSYPRQYTHTKYLHKHHIHTIREQTAFIQRQFSNMATCGTNKAFEL